jgi:hypothetical protein
VRLRVRVSARARFRARARIRVRVRVRVRVRIRIRIRLLTMTDIASACFIFHGPLFTSTDNALKQRDDWIKQLSFSPNFKGFLAHDHL